MKRHSKLLIYAASDHLTSAAEHHYIGGIVNHVRPGQATVLILEGVDHYFQRVPSPPESIRAARVPSLRGPSDHSSRPSGSTGSCPSR